jgi:hypothetical protein
MFRNGREFEKGVFGYSSGREGFHFKAVDRGFARSIETLIVATQAMYPQTSLGGSIYVHVARELTRHGIDPKKLVFIPAVNTAADFYHKTDGFFYHPDFHPHLVTLDLFHIDHWLLNIHKEGWIDTSPKSFYSTSNFQSDLFAHKCGLMRLKKRNPGMFKQAVEFDKIQQWKLIDYRRFCPISVGRPENHFIVTPDMVTTYESRREFAKMVASYFIGLKSGPKMNIDSS